MLGAGGADGLLESPGEGWQNINGVSVWKSSRLHIPFLEAALWDLGVSILSVLCNRGLSSPPASAELLQRGYARGPFSL